MGARNTVNSARVGMMRGKRFSPKEIERYEMALKQNVDNTRVETIFLYFAEALHDLYGFGMKRTSKVINTVDENMHEWLRDDFNMDDLRLRVFEKTRFLFTCDAEEQKHVHEMLAEAGYILKTEEDLK